MRATTLLLPAALASSALGLNIVNSERTEWTAVWPSQEAVVYSGEAKPYGGTIKLPDYDTTRFVGGLHFTNGMSNEVNGAFGNSDNFNGLSVGAHGAGTTVRFGGTMQCDGGNGFALVSLTGGARWSITPQAHLDFVNTSFYTRQLWIRSADGTGVFEVEEGFVADRTAGGTVGDGVGSYRLSAATLVTHSTAGLPQHRRATGYNGHLVFEDQPGSKWITTGNDQEYAGSIWIWRDAAIETRSSLTHTGKLVNLDGYVLAGAFQTLSDNVVVTKAGAGTLHLAGEQAYSTGARLRIVEGTVRFGCDAAGGTLRGGIEGASGQHLAVEVGTGGICAVETPLFRIRSLTMESGSRLVVGTAGTVNVAGTATAEGTLAVVASASISAGDEFNLFDWTEVSGRFATVELPQGVVWDTTRLYTQGIIKATSGSTAIHRPLQIESAGAAAAPRLIAPLRTPIPARGVGLSGRTIEGGGTTPQPIIVR